MKKLAAAFSVLCALVIVGVVCALFFFPEEEIDPCIPRIQQFHELQETYAAQLPRQAHAIRAAANPIALKQLLGNSISHDAETTPYGNLNFLVAQDERYLDQCPYQ